MATTNNTATIDSKQQIRTAVTKTVSYKLCHSLFGTAMPGNCYFMSQERDFRYGTDTI